jgi:uridylate kinase
LHAPFDPVASRLAEKWGIEVVVMKGVNNLKKFIEGKKFEGSIIK